MAHGIRQSGLANRGVRSSGQSGHRTHFGWGAECRKGSEEELNRGVWSCQENPPDGYIEVNGGDDAKFDAADIA